MSHYILGIDPSGSYNEGKGITGFVLLGPDGSLEDHYVIKASDYKSQTEYWGAIVSVLSEEERPELVLSVEDYVLYKSAAKAQINSEMETSKLIGVIQYMAHMMGLPIYLRTASQVMKRWDNRILEHKGLIVRHGVGWADKSGKPINHHCLDALRHACHCHYFEVDKKEGRS